METSCIKGEHTSAAVRGADYTKAASRGTFHLLAKMLAKLSPGEGFHWLAWESMPFPEPREKCYDWY